MNTRKDTDDMHDGDIETREIMADEKFFKELMRNRASARKGNTIPWEKVKQSV